MSLCLLFFVLFQAPAKFEPAHLKQIAPVQHNPNIIAGTWVISDLGVGIDGHVHFTKALKGEEPFRSSVFSSVRRWSFAPARTTIPVEAHATAVFLFRSRDMFSASPPDLSDMDVPGVDKPPIPISLSDPGYMPDSVAEGEVILELQISSAGSIETVRIVKDIPGLTAFTERAVRSWRFEPASWSGYAVPGTVIAVISYLRPV